MKDLKEYIDGKVVDGYVSLEDCLSALEQAYNDGLKDNKKDSDEIKRPLWKDDYEAYLSIVKDSRESLLFDDRHKALFLKYNPRCDYKLTIEKTIEMFWGTEDGWNYCKKKRKGKTLDMVATLRKNLERNRVYVNAKDSYVQSRIAEIDSKMKEEQFR
mgnify:FL=1